MLLAVGAGLWFQFERPRESLTDSVFRICNACGLEESEIDSLIDIKSRSPLTREQEIELYHKTFTGDEPPANAKLCLPCVEAVLDAVENR